jgi:Cu2+-exporting ATPase
MPTFEFDVQDIYCPACAVHIENSLKEKKYIKSIVVNSLDKIATVELNENTPEIINQLKTDMDDCGYPCTNIVDVEKRNRETQKAIRKSWQKGAAGIIGGLALIGTSFFAMVPIAAMGVIAGISSALTFYLGKDTYALAVSRFLKSKKLTMEALFTVSTVLAVVVSCLAFAFPWMPMMFDAALLILGFKNIGTAIKESAKQRISNRTLSSYAPTKIKVATDATVEQEFTSAELVPGTSTPVVDLVPGQIIIVPSQQTVPVDGVCLTKKEGTSIYTTMMTGKTEPQAITYQQPIQAGSVVPKDVPYIKIQVAAKAEDSYLAQYDQSIKAAERQKAPIETATAKSLEWFIPAVFTLAVLSGLIVGFLLSPAAGILTSISVLVSACPCTMGLITPLDIKTGIVKAAEHGIIFKSGKGIEEAAQTNSVAFDYNATLSTGEFKVMKSTIPEDMQNLFVKIESQSDHPIAEAIVKGFSNATRPEEFKKFACERFRTGIVAVADNKKFIVGNRQMLRDHEIPFAHLEAEIAAIDAEQVVFLANEKNVLGYVLLTDPLRDDAVETIAELQNQDKTVYMCTGADFDTAKRAAEKLRIPLENIRANCLAFSNDPKANTKSKFIKECMDRGELICHVGDGDNDGEAVAKSSCGIAVLSKTGGRITQQKAGAIVPADSLWSIVTLFEISNQTVKNIKQNLFVSIAYNILAMAAFGGVMMALGIKVHPALAAFFMILQTVLILLNVEIFRRQTVTPRPTPSPSKNKLTHNLRQENLKSLNAQSSKLQPSPQESISKTISIKNSGDEEMLQKAKLFLMRVIDNYIASLSINYYGELRAKNLQMQIQGCKEKDELIPLIKNFLRTGQTTVDMQWHNFFRSPSLKSSTDEFSLRGILFNYFFPQLPKLENWMRNLTINDILKNEYNDVILDHNIVACFRKC